MSKWISCQNMTVAEMLSGARGYDVPAYQRAYSWGAEQAGMLIADLLERFRQAQDTPDDDIWPLFLGAVVVSADAPQDRLMVIDGQQRLITLTILLAVLRDLENNPDADKFAAFIMRELKSNPAAQAEFRVRPRPIDHEFFAHYVQAKGATFRFPPGYDGEVIAAASAGFRESGAEEEIDLGFDSAAEDIAGGGSDGNGDDHGGPLAAAAERAHAPEAAQNWLPSGTPQQMSALQGQHAPHDLSDSRRRIIINRELLKEVLSELSVEERRALVDFLINHAEMTVTCVSNPEYATNVFLTIHQSGIDLSDGDILKAEILANAGAGEIDRLADRWDTIEALLGRKDFARLFSHLRWIAQRRRQHWAIAREIRLAYLPADNPAAFIEETLRPAAEKYFQIRHAAYRCIGAPPGEEDVCARINRLMMFLSWNENTAWVTPLLHFLMKHGDRPNEVLQFLALFDRLVGSMTVRRIVEPQRTQRYLSILAAIDDGTILNLRKSPLALREKEKHDTLATIASLRFGRFKSCRMVLMRLDAELGSNATASDYRHCTIEHILPQNPRDNSQWTSGFASAEIANESVNRLGNLCLLSRRDNLIANNHEFAGKLAVYFAADNDSPFLLKEQLRNMRAWNVGEVERREKRLLMRIKNMWRL